MLNKKQLRLPRYNDINCSKKSAKRYGYVYAVGEYKTVEA